MSRPDAPAGDAAVTKTCPYCAETIKAAAVKCRYCQSDLAGALPAAPTPPDPAPTPASTPAPAGPGTESQVTTARRTGRPSWFLPAAAAAVLATLLLLGLAWRAWDRAGELEDADAAARAVQATVAERVEALFSYEHSTFDEDIAVAREGMTDSFREEYEPTVAEIRDRAVRQRRSQQADVVAVSVISSSSDRVHTLLFVNTFSSREGRDEQDVRQNRVDVTMIRDDDGTWLIDDVSVPES